MKTFKEWLIIKENIFDYPIEIKWMQLPIATLKQYLQRVLNVLGKDDNESDPHVEHLKVTIRGLILQMKQRYGLALDSELDMLAGLT